MKDYQYTATVIIPIYNAEKYLEDCLNCIVDQTIEKNQLEVLLIDDGSNDNSKAIEERFVAKYQYIQKNKQQAVQPRQKEHQAKQEQRFPENQEKSQVLTLKVGPDSSLLI